MNFFVLFFYISMICLYLFLFRRETIYVRQRFIEAKPGLLWIILFSSLIFVDILPVNSTMSFRIVNFIFYLGFFWIVIRVIQLGWKQFVVILFRPPIGFFIVFSLVCLGSAFFTGHASHSPIGGGIQHAMRLLIFFVSVPILAQRTQNLFLNINIISALFFILLLRVLLPISEALFSDNILPWEWMKLNQDYDWYRWSFVSDWIGYQNFSKGDNSMGIMVNSFGFVLAIILLILINQFFEKKNIDWRLILPILFCAVVLYQLGTQTAYIIVLLGLIPIFISKQKWWSLISFLLVFFSFLMFYKTILKRFIFGTTFQSFLENDYRVTVIFPSAIKGFFDRPWFGHGYVGGEYLYFQDYGLPSNIIEAHNAFLSVALNTGLLGLIPFILGLFSIAWILFRFWINSKLNILSTNLVILFVSTSIASLFLTDFFYKFDDTLLIRMFPFFIILLASQIISGLSLHNAK